MTATNGGGRTHGTEPVPGDWSAWSGDLARLIAAGGMWAATGSSAASIEEVDDPVLVLLARLEQHLETPEDCVDWLTDERPELGGRSAISSVAAGRIADVLDLIGPH